MNLHVVYCNHHSAKLETREKLAFSPERLTTAYSKLRGIFPKTELVVLSTCNRVEVYTANPAADAPLSQLDVAHFLSDFHQVPLREFFDDLIEQTGHDAVRHLFQVAASIDSMVLGEPQIVAQVRDAYRLAQENLSSGPITSALFERALKVSKRVRTETKIVEGKVSIASVAIGDFGKSIFDRFDDKTIVVLGAGAMAEETLRYLLDEGASGKIYVVNRSQDRAQEVANRWGGEALPWEQLDHSLAQADIIVSTTGATEHIVDLDRFRQIRKKAGDRPVFILDLGAPRDFDPRIAGLDSNIFLYCIDDLEAICARNRKSRQIEVEKALKIVDEEASRFLGDLAHRSTGPIIKRLREQWEEVVAKETERLFQKLPHLNTDRAEIERSIERMVGKLLHPPLEALRDEANQGTPHGLLSALKRLFGLGE